MTSNYFEVLALNPAVGRTIGPHDEIEGYSGVCAGDALGDARAGNRTLGREDRTVLGILSLGVLLVVGFAATFPALVGCSVALAGAWPRVATGIRAYVQAGKAHAEEHAAPLLSGVKREEGERAEVAADSAELESEHGSP